MSLPRPIRPYDFQADLIWWDGPFNGKLNFGHIYYLFLNA
jgi:hypothetical protein